jgi:integrase
VETGELTVKDLCNRFLTAKKYKLDAGELSPRMFAEYKQTAERLAEQFGKNRLVIDLASDDFEALRAAMTWGPVRLGNEVQRVRTIFKYGFEAGLIDKPVRFGPEFKKPAKNVLRKHRADGGKRMFTAAEVRALLDAASPALRAMILLGISCGFGNSDCGSLLQSKLDLDGGWVDHPRPKNGIQRRCALWSEAVAALRQAIAERPEPKDAANADLVFVTKYGRPWSSDGASDAVTQEFGKVLRSLKINGRRGLGFYSLRHTFRTIADATRDFPAVRLVMGHADASIDDAYREDIGDDRLRAVADYVRVWLYAPAVGDNADLRGLRHEPRSSD